MSWEDRITDLVYTSPSGKVFTGIFENVSKVISKKTTAFNFPDVAGTFVQDLEKNGRRYPLRWIFSGENYDKDAEDFDNALEEKGPGVLQHPLYGTFDVIPFGDITRRDDLVTAANQAVYDIIFYETIKIIFPLSEIAVTNQLDKGFGDFSENSVSFWDVVLSTAQEITGFIASAKSGLRKIKKAMAKVAATTASIERAFNDLADLADDTITTLIGGPSLIAFQLIQLTRLPSRTEASIQAKLDAYRNLIDSLINGPGNQFTPGLDSQSGNAYATNNLIASSGVLGSIESGSVSTFITRSETIAALEALDDQFTDYINWSDTNRETLVEGILPTREPGTQDLIDTGESYQNLLDVFALSQGRLTQIAFTALQERSVILDRDRTFIDFCAEFYGQLDEQYDFVIQTCNLTGEEIVNGMKRGRSMVYYV